MSWIAKKIEQVEIDRIKPYERNARTHSQHQIELLVKAIREFGFTTPVLMKSDGTLVAGHGRLEAAKLVGMTVVPAIFVDHLSARQLKALVIADNKIATLAGWDLEALSAELSDLSEMDFDLALTGFDEQELDALLKDDAGILPEGFNEPEKIQVSGYERTVKNGLTDDDAAPELPEATVTKRGDVWVLGDHRLLCGDSTNADDVAALMDGETADMVFTDPPYGINYQSNHRVKSKKFDVIKNDDVILTDWLPVVSGVANGFCFIWTTWKVLGNWIEATRDFAPLTNVVIWSKGGGGIGDLEKTFATDYEMALVFNRGASIVGKRIGSVWSIGKDRPTEYLHPTQKPVELAMMAIESVSKRGQIVLDVFGGSGSTLIACEKSDRGCRMMEISESYCDVIVQRWQKFTGREAIHAETGKTFEQVRNERA